MFWFDDVLLVKLLLMFGCEVLVLELCLGDVDMVVVFVVVVGGWFLLEFLDMVVLEFEGILFVSLSWLICDFRLFSLFYIVDGVVVDEEDLLFLMFWLVLVFGMGLFLEGIMGFGIKGDE